MKAIEQCIYVLLFIMLHRFVLTLESVVAYTSLTIQMNATEQYFSVVLLIVLYKVVLLLLSLFKCMAS